MEGICISDRVLVFTDPNGEKVAIKAGDTPKVGDRVVVFETGDGELITPGKQDFKVGDRVLVFDTPEGLLMVKSGEIVNEYDTCVLVSNTWLRTRYSNGELVLIGSFKFNWSGNGRVYLNNTCDNVLKNTVYADDLLIAETGYGQAQHDYGGLWSGPPLEITDILRKGVNTVKISVKDVYGGNIGIKSPLYIKVIP